MLNSGTTQWLHENSVPIQIYPYVNVLQEWDPNKGHMPVLPYVEAQITIPSPRK